jgi:hypothetical protein
MPEDKPKPKKKAKPKGKKPRLESVVFLRDAPKMRKKKGDTDEMKPARAYALMNLGIVKPA